jgi:hypothetical protein
VKVTFAGGPPYELPLTQNAQADALDDTVMLTLYALIPELGPTLFPITTPMTWKVATALSVQLARAGLAAELKSQSRRS